MPRSFLTRRRRKSPSLGLLWAVVAAALVPAAQSAAASAPASGVQVSSSGVTGTDGQRYTVTNHLVPAAAAGPARHEYLLAWSGDAGAEGNPAGQAGAGDPDFMAVIDVTRGSAQYGKVVNTATFAPVTQNEPHHMQYAWHRGQRIYAGGFLSDAIYVLDATRLPQLRLTGVNLAQDTPCGSVPDAFTLLRDGTAYGTDLGGPDVAGPCRYTNGQVRVGNGFAGSPGSLLRLDQHGRTLAQTPSATAGPELDECHNLPVLPQATCANPHGIQLREDLNRLVTSDMAEATHLIGANMTDPFTARDSVRIYDISRRNDPKLISVSHLPIGPRNEQNPFAQENRTVMENAVTNLPGHRGAFAETFGGGALYYTPDITAKNPQWREIYDDTAAYRTFDPQGNFQAGGDAGSWLQVSPDDRYLFHTVMGFAPPPFPKSGMIYVLDIRKLLAAGNATSCAVDTAAEVTAGGAEADCPALVNAIPLQDDTSGGPHWAAMDNFRPGLDGYFRETRNVGRIAVSNYFLAPALLDGNHRVCMVDVDRTGHVSLEAGFRDELTGQTCVDFNRTNWPHGQTGFARPHGVLFVVPDADLRAGRS